MEFQSAQPGRKRRHRGLNVAYFRSSTCWPNTALTRHFLCSSRLPINDPISSNASSVWGTKSRVMDGLISQYIKWIDAVFDLKPNGPKTPLNKSSRPRWQGTGRHIFRLFRKRCGLLKNSLPSDFNTTPAYSLFARGVTEFVIFHHVQRASGRRQG